MGRPARVLAADRRTLRGPDGGHRPAAQRTLPHSPHRAVLSAVGVQWPLAVGAGPLISIFSRGEKRENALPRPALSPSQREGGLRRSPRGGKARGVGGVRWPLAVGAGPLISIFSRGEKRGECPARARPQSLPEGGRFKAPPSGEGWGDAPPFSVVVCGDGLCYSQGARGRATRARTLGGNAVGYPYRRIDVDSHIQEKPKHVDEPYVEGEVGRPDSPHPPGPRHG